MSLKDHNKGQTDAANGEYNPPHSILDDLLTWSDDGVQKLAEENSDYNDGWRNTKDQKDD